MSPRVRLVPDVDQLLVALAQRDIPTATVTNEPDVDTAFRLPMIVVSAGNGTRVEQSEAAKVWNFTAHFMVVAATQAEASDLADQLYETVWKWANPWTQSGTISGVGAITDLEDISVPARTATSATPAGDLTQYDATFSINVRKA